MRQMQEIQTTGEMNRTEVHDGRDSSHRENLVSSSGNIILTRRNKTQFPCFEMSLSANVSHSILWVFSSVSGWHLTSGLMRQNRLSIEADWMEGSKHWWPPLTAFRWTPQRNESESAVKNQMLLCSVLKEVVRWRPLQVSSSRSVGAGLHDAPTLGEDLEGAVADGCSGLTSEIFWK